MDEKGLGKRIQLMRKNVKLTQQDLCHEADLSYSTLAKIERGAIKAPSVFTVQGIARALNITMDELLGDVHSAKNAALAKRTSSKGVKFIYFDVNGCLVRSFQRAFDELAAKSGAPKEVIQTTYEHYNSTVCRGDMSLEEFNEALARQIGQVRVRWEDYYLQAVKPVAGMLELVKSIAEQYRVGLLTNTMPTLIGAMLDSGDLPNIKYDAVVESCEVKSIKPLEPIFTIAADMAQAQPNEILLVDDTRTNLIAAEEQGWQTLWFDDYFPAESITKLRAALDL